MATYNGEMYIAEQVHSILGQIGTDDELIVSDDGSTDATTRIIEGFGDSRIRLIYNNSGRGYTRNFENAIRNAAGQIIFTSDQDDVWLENKVEVMRTHLELYDLVVSDATYVNEALKVTHGSHFRLVKMNSGFIRQAIKPCYIGACMAFRRSVLDILLPFPRNASYCAYDYWLTLVGESCFRVGLVNHELMLYRRHAGNASPTGKKSRNSFAKKALIRLYSLMVLTRRVAAKSFSMRSTTARLESVAAHPESANHR